PQGTPQATARMLSRIKASGLHPLELAGETKGWLTFGVVDPTEFSDRPAWSHDGLHGDGDVDPPIWQFRTGDGTVALVEPPATPAAPGVARRTTHARRAAYRVQPDQLERLE